MNNLLSFLHMGGYGVYVWSSYGLVFLVLGIQAISSWRRLHHCQKIQSNTSHASHS